MFSKLELEAIEAMKREGGSFVRCLGEAFSHADAINARRLKDAFPDYWEEYKGIAKLRRAQR
jgi:hypothetical protein